MTLEEFEHQLMEALLAGDDPMLAALRVQYAAATAREREKSATGFVTRFDVPSDLPAIDRKLMHLDDLQVQLAGAAAPVETSVEVRNGRLSKLEYFVYRGAFPESPVIEAARYYSTENFPGITPELMAERDVEEMMEEDE